MRKAALISVITFFVTLLAITGFSGPAGAQVNGCYNSRDGTFRILIGSDECKKGEVPISLYTKENVDALIATLQAKLDAEVAARQAADETLQTVTSLLTAISVYDKGLDGVCEIGYSNNIQPPPPFCFGSGGYPKAVFLSSQTYSANLGGLAGADAKCQELASAAGLQGIFMAWLSDSTTDAHDRLTPSSIGYARIDGVIVADNWADLVNGSLDAPINVTETGQLLTGSYYTLVWTGTNWNGARAPAAYCDCQGYCDDWMTGEYNGKNTARYGFANFPTGYPNFWTFISNSSASCAVDQHLYCFQQ